MLTQEIFAAALNITSPWLISAINFDYENRKLDIHLDFEKGSEFEYTLEDGSTGTGKAYDTVEKTWRHLNFFQHECYLHARVPRIRREDNSIRLIKTPWEGKMKGFTLLFEALALQLCTAMPVLKASQIMSVSDDKLWDMLHRYVGEAVDQMDLSELKVMGLDETSKAKGHDYITLFVNLMTKRVVYITEGKDSGTIADFVDFLTSHGGDAEQITDVSSDMSRAFIKGIQENLPNAEITFDKFHILKIINEAVDKVRRQEAKEQETLKNTRYIFLKNNSNLSAKQRAKLEELKMSKLNLKSLRAMHIRENFQEIYHSVGMEEFEIKLKKWYFWATHSRLEPIKEAAYTIKRHWAGVLKWWESKINNGVLEGLNSVIQAAKAKARGYKLSRNLIIIAYLLAGDIDLASLNHNYEKLG
jgi:transposase